LFEKEGGVVCVALFFDAFNPLWLHGSYPRTGFPAHDDPLDMGEIEDAQILQQGLHAQKMDNGPDLFEEFD